MFFKKNSESTSILRENLELCLNFIDDKHKNDPNWNTLKKSLVNSITRLKYYELSSIAWQPKNYGVSGLPYDVKTGSIDPEIMVECLKFTNKYNLKEIQDRSADKRNLIILGIITCIVAISSIALKIDSLVSACGPYIAYWLIMGSVVLLSAYILALSLQGSKSLYTLWSLDNELKSFPAPVTAVEVVEIQSLTINQEKLESQMIV